jgi:5-methylcytosine-specific restriction endonuclease McrA
MARWIRPERRLAIYIRDEFICGYCGTHLKNSPPEDVTLDHLVPRNPNVPHGNGGNETTNLTTACRACNSSRGDRPWMDYATGGARDRIETRRYQPINLDLAKAILNDTAGDDALESLR